MNTRNDKETNLERSAEAGSLRALLEAAADPEPPTAAPPFFAARVRALAVETRQAPQRTQLALAATRLLPVFALVALVLVGAAGYESVVSASEREAAVARALARNGGSDAVIGAVLLASPGEGSTGGSR